MMAANNLDILLLLVENGADINAINEVPFFSLNFGSAYYITCII